ncbi:MAG: hypothetical protein HRT89_01515 [Lentisphaeria bacterium]|nr:hypothetical protein [Lentisphaeria bacterium]
MSNDFNERNATAPKEYERVERTRINKASNKTDYFERSPSGAFIFPENGRPNSFNINWSKIRNIISSSGTGSLTESDMGSLTEGDQSSLTESDMGSLTEGDQSSLTEGDMGSLTE